ncbi:major facilitator superfamily mfs 1 [Nannochloropsis gaditana CCMP526]|nr:major facilitator superfamily mfs 1 [Nannochloropsis gaditana CCMP526]EKU22683.1 major facilitator superfamily mfs 1 [Nannochloropsis gaditana CCMP526]|eukprot:XP_005853679.1 major facilitator superfamily mfs 1 [Nannochloropsis gaditana CCMP526]
MSDKFGFKHAFIAMATVQAVTLALYDKLASSKLTFALGTMSVYFTLGGVFAMFPPAVQKRFGARNGVTIYSYLFTAFALASVGGSILAKRLVAYFGGYENVFKIFSASSVGALGLAALLPEV